MSIPSMVHHVNFFARPAGSARSSALWAAQKCQENVCRDPCCQGECGVKRTLASLHREGNSSARAKTGPSGTPDPLE